MRINAIASALDADDRGTSAGLSVGLSPNRARGGYSIMEVLFAVGLVGFVFTGVFSGISFGFAVLQTARENLRATQVLQEKMETIRLYNWEQLNTAGFFPTTFTASARPLGQSDDGFYQGTITITDAPLTESYAPSMRQMLVELTWNSGGVQRHRNMTTFVSRYGLQNYIY